MSDETPRGDDHSKWATMGPPAYAAETTAAPELPATPGSDIPPPVLDGPGPDGHFGEHVPQEMLLHRRHFVQQGPVFATPWRRFCAAWVTGWLTFFVLVTGFMVIRFGSHVAFDTMQTCGMDSGGRHFCRSTKVPLIIGGVVAIVYALIATYLIWSRSVVAKRGAVGTRQMGMSVRMASTGDLVHDKAVGFRRSFPIVIALSWSGALVLVSMITQRTGPAWDTVLGIQIFWVAALMLGAGYMVFDDRRRALWDVAAKTVIVVDQEPSWYAITSLVFGVMVPYSVFVTLLFVSTDQLRAEYNDLVDHRLSTSSILAVALPIGVVAVLAIVFGHIGLRETRWEIGRVSGRGIAMAGALLGYAVPVSILLSIGLSFTVHRVETFNSKNCKAMRHDITQALESYRTLNNDYPTGLSSVSGAVYLGELPPPEQWSYDQKSADNPFTYKLVGKGKCDGL